jgi:hypothetical protein
MLKLPYIEKVEERGDLQAWVVDGTYIRGNIDEEFTNYGQHYRFTYIPENELWLDREAASDERQFFIDHLLVEHRLMKKGLDYDQALVAADRAERKERRLSGDIARVIKRGDNLTDAAKVHQRLWKKLESGISVWIVSGRLVRSVFDIDFTEGGHDYVYEFVPQNEVWIDDDVEEAERAFILVHELHERNRMAVGLTYNQAHTESSRLEYRCRHHPDELHEALEKEGWA